MFHTRVVPYLFWIAALVANHVMAAEPVDVTWQVDLLGGGRIVGKPVEPAVVLQTEFGNLTVPVAQVRQLTPGLASRPEWERRVETLVKQLGAAEFAAREEASNELATIRTQAQAVLEAARDDADAERRVRARRIVQTKPEAKPGEQPQPAWPRHDMLDAGVQKLAGKVRSKSLPIDTAYGRVTVPLAAVAAIVPPPSNRPVDLLKEIDLERDAIVSGWTWAGPTLVSPKKNRARLQIAYAPPEEYTLVVTALPKEGREVGGKPVADSLFIGLVVGTRTCNVALNAFADVKGGPFAGLDTLRRRRTHLEPLFKGSVLSLGEEATVEIAVRRASVAVSVGGKPLFVWTGDPKELDTDNQWQLREPRRLGLGAHQTQFHIRRFALTPIIEPPAPRELGRDQTAVRTKDGSLWIGRLPTDHTKGQPLRLETAYGLLIIPAEAVIP